MPDNASNILELLIQHELVIKQLYTVFAANFGHRQNFWQNLANEEQRHADWLKTLQSEEATKRWFQSSSRLVPQAINTSIKYIEAQILKANQKQISSREAFSIAKDLESSLLEKQFSKISDLAPAKIKTILQKLAAETEKHRIAIVAVSNTESSQSH